MTEAPYAFLRSIIEDVRPTGWAIEFGVFSGVSLAMIAEYMPVIGLDSFEGLPEDWREGYPKGEFAYQEGQPYPFTSNAMIIPGWFEDTLPLLRERGLPPLGLVHIDCDIYSSTVTALEGIIGSISEGTVVSFDEYHGYPGWEDQEAKAWGEFCAERKISYSTLGSADQQRAFRIEQFG